MFPGYSKNGKILHLNQMFYSFRQFFLLWQQKLTKKMTKIGFKKNLQKICIVQKNDIIKFFYVDNIIFIFKKN